MSENRLEVGDKVMVNFHNQAMTLCLGELLYMPCATGDSWIIKAESGDLHYITEACTITRTNP
jgi:hypothetical protein